ncbi:MAG: tetratricopeptide repeat protein [Proteobacteria bacterium]|nr:tetratricopeptide repeat protein [Pseudomonadota bacterium]
MTRDHRRLAAIVSFDVAGYSRLMGADESGTLASLKAHRRELIDPKIAEHEGRIVKTTGDGLLVEFASVVDAVRCAVEVQRGMAERNAGALPDKRLDFRIGINVGDIIIDGDDIFGDGVNVAARLEALAEPGGICVSRVVRDQVLDKLSFSFEDLGKQEVKNIVHPVEVFRVAIDSAGPVSTSPTAAGRTRTSPHPSTRRSRPGRALLAVAVLAILGLAAWSAYRALVSPAVVVPYSAQDRRMTFAVLPFHAPAGDAGAVSVAAATTDAAIAVEEGNVVWAQVASRRSVGQALAQHTGARDIGKALDVHFLIRGNVTPAASGYRVEMLMVDVSTERAIGTKSLPVAADAVMPRREDLQGALGMLTYNALQSEVQRARAKPAQALDVRDLSFRAYVDWGEHKQHRDEKGAYVAATDLLNRALALAPDDPLALYLTAQVNLCDCVNGWSKNVEEQQAIGAAALEKYLRHDPDSPRMLNLKSELFALHGRYEESLLVTESVLKRNPDNTEAQWDEAYALLKLGRPKDASAVIDKVLASGAPTGADVAALAAAVDFTLGRYDDAARMARSAVTGLSHDDLRNSRLGAVGLTLVAAEARLGHAAQARAALADFEAAVPGVQSIAAIKAWMHPAADLAGFQPLFDGLRLAGIHD